MRVLIVEDEERLAQNVASGLRQCAGYAVDVANDGESGLFMAAARIRRLRTFGKIPQVGSRDSSPDSHRAR